MLTADKSPYLMGKRTYLQPEQYLRQLVFANEQPSCSLGFGKRSIGGTQSVANRPRWKFAHSHGIDLVEGDS